MKNLNAAARAADYRARYGEAVEFVLVTEGALIGATAEMLVSMEAGCKEGGLEYEIVGRS